MVIWQLIDWILFYVCKCNLTKQWKNWKSTCPFIGTRELERKREKRRRSWTNVKGECLDTHINTTHTKWSTLVCIQICIWSKSNRKLSNKSKKGEGRTPKFTKLIENDRKKRVPFVFFTFSYDIPTHTRTHPLNRPTQFVSILSLQWNASNFRQNFPELWKRLNKLNINHFEFSRLPRQSYDSNKRQFEKIRK